VVHFWNILESVWERTTDFAFMELLVNAAAAISQRRSGY
jgi:hypothetical protein